MVRQRQQYLGEEIWAARCFCAYIVYRLYTPHPIAVNPFLSVLENSLPDKEPQTAPATGPEIIFGNVLDLIISDRGEQVPVHPRN